MNNIIYRSYFKDHLENHVALKKAVGYKYDAEAGHLQRFDRFISEQYPNAIALTKEIVLDWCKKRSYEAQENQNARASVIRQFGKYLDSIGSKAYIIPQAYYPSARQYMPYIYTTDELKKLFAETDKCKYCCECPYRHLSMPVIFRMLYMCGLRLSEARLLKVTDVDLENGVLTINYSKNDNSRLIPMSDYLISLCRDFFAKAHKDPGEEDYFFPALDGSKPMTMYNIYHNFRRFLRRAGISHGGKGCGPRIHDLRHTYAVHCLKKLVKQQKDLAVYLPVLKTYMGHGSFMDTAYYLRLTADVFPDITLKLEALYHNIIPKLEGGIYETH